LVDRLNWENYPQLDRRLVELNHELGDYLSGTELHERIALTLTDEYGNALGREFSPDAIRNRLKRVRFAQLAEDPEMVLMPHFQEYREIILGTAPVPAKEVNGLAPGDYLASLLVGRRKHLVISDLHIPTQDEWAIQVAVERNLTADLVVINGDLMDSYALSTFIKKKDIPIYEELDGVVRFLKWIAGVFPNALIWIDQGNHEDRVYKRILPVLPAGLEFLARTDLLDMLARPFPNVLAASDWFVGSIGDAIYAHAEASSSIPGRAATTTGDWFLNHNRQLGIGRPRFVSQAHTHKVSVVYDEGQDMKVVESGCLCHSQDYARTTRSKKPQVQGYVTVIQNDGVTDLANSREHVFMLSERKGA
jgi:hypothetical protein